MSKEHRTPDQELEELLFTEHVVDIKFVPTIGPNGGKMYEVEATIIEEPVKKTGALPSVQPVWFDKFGNKTSGFRDRLGGVEGTVYTPAQARVLMDR